eukprot:TRINITY_DN17341_c0_g1_i1.p1 TRINITY_DN17341_c0_g1~~TRINITY_DN17341_c0_g1_i1.p1  ORF type:complete len:654 (+),score=78.90 TRINITY_DN17341_c0_g1_i1:31-1992(+)
MKWKRLIFCFFLLFYCAEAQLVCFLLSDLSAFSWTYKIERGRDYIEDKIDSVTTRAFFGIRTEPLVDSDLLLSQTHNYIREGCDIITLGHFQFLKPLFDTIKRHKNISFICLGCSERNLPNLVNAYAKVYEPIYISGLIAGAFTKSKQVGIIVGKLSPNTVRSINAFALGVHDVDPSVSVKLTLTNHWDDLRLSSQAVEQLIKKEKADIIFPITNINDVYSLICKLGRYSIGYYSEMDVFYGPSVLTGGIFNWGPLFSHLVEKYNQNEWPSGEMIWYGLKDEGAYLGKMSYLIPWEMKKKAIKLKYEFSDNNTEMVFCGDYVKKSFGVEDSMSNCLSNNQLENMTRLLPNIISIPGDFYFNELFWDYHNPWGIILLLSTGWGMILLLIFLCLLIRHWHTPVFIFASPLFCLIVLLGASLCYCCVVLHVFEPTNITCPLRWWTLGLSYIIMYSSVCVKTYRVWRIHCNMRLLKETMITNYQLLGIVCLCLALEVLFLLIWTLVGGINRVLIVIDGLAPDERAVDCGGDYYFAFTIAFFSFNAIPLVFSAFLATVTRNVAVGFNESFTLALMTYNVTVFYVCVVPLYFFLQNLYLFMNLLIATIVWYLVTSTICLLFLTKIYIAVFKPKKNTFKIHRSTKDTPVYVVHGNHAHST